MGVGAFGVDSVWSHGDGPNDMGAGLPDVDLGKGKKAVALGAGENLTCALLEEGAIKCWGSNSKGELGLGDTEPRGDAPGEMGDALPTVDLGPGKKAVALGVGDGPHVCALLDDATIKCWGANSYGQLGQGDTAARGSQPGHMGDALLPVKLGQGSKPVAIAVGNDHTCALLADGRVKCWGSNQLGQLGLGHTDSLGAEPGEMGDALPAVDLGTGKKAVAIAAGASHTCALLDDGAVKCWGGNSNGALGIGTIDDRGDEPGEMGDLLPAVSLF
jgi:alpha-tubulin suppressor-like RCC1 family protein